MFRIIKILSLSLSLWFASCQTTTLQNIEKEVKVKCVSGPCDGEHTIQIFIREKDVRTDKPTGEVKIRKGVYNICCKDLPQFINVLKEYADMDDNTRIPGPRQYFTDVNVQPFIVKGENGCIIANKKSGHSLTGEQFKHLIISIEKLTATCCPQ